MKWIATAIATIVAALGAVGVVWPDGLLLAGRQLGTPIGLHVVAGVRILFGTSLLFCAHTSHAPNFLRVFGAFVLIAGLATPLIGHDRASLILEYFAKQDAVMQRFAAAIAAGIGLSIVWALSPKSGPLRR